MSDHCPACRHAASYDWSDSMLGGLEQWTAPLRVAADLLLNLSQPALLVWGRETVVVYNEAYAQLAGSTASAAPGGKIPPLLPPPLSAAGPALQQAWQGQPQCLRQLHMTFRHAGGDLDYLCDLRITPLAGADGTVAGLALVLDAPHEEVAPLPEAAAPLRILVVEDNPDAQYLVCEMLRAFGHEANGVLHPDDALAWLAREHVDVLFSDLSLPGMSGVDLARRALSTHAGLQVIFASGYGDTLLTGLDFPYLSLQKPYELDQLQAALEQLSPRQAA